jgi:hypothetical protein
MNFQDPELASKALEIMRQAMEAAQKSNNKLRKLQRGVDCIQNNSEVGSLTKGHQSGLRQAQRLSCHLGGVLAAVEANLVEVGDGLRPATTEFARVRNPSVGGRGGGGGTAEAVPNSRWSPW